MCHTTQHSTVHCTWGVPTVQHVSHAIIRTLYPVASMKGWMDGMVCVHSTYVSETLTFTCVNSAGERERKSYSLRQNQARKGTQPTHAHAHAHAHTRAHAHTPYAI